MDIYRGFHKWRYPQLAGWFISWKIPFTNRWFLVVAPIFIGKYWKPPYSWYCSCFHRNRVFSHDCNIIFPYFFWMICCDGLNLAPGESTERTSTSSSMRPRFGTYCLATPGCKNVFSECYRCIYLSLYIYICI